MADTAVAAGITSETALDSAPETGETQTSASTPAQPEAPKDDRFAAKFAALTRAEKQSKAAAKAVADEKAAVLKMREELEEQKKNSFNYKDKMKDNVVKFLEEEGYTYEQISEMVLNEGNPTTDMKMERMRRDLESKTSKELEALRKELADRDAKESEREKENANRQYEQVKQNFKTQIKGEIEANAEKFELVHYNGQEGIDLAYEVMESYYESTAEKDEAGTIIKPGKVLEIQDALQEVELYFEEQARPLTKLKKFQQTSQAQPKQPSEGKETAPTLSNTLSADVPSNGQKRMSKEEAFQEALKHIRYNNE